VEAQAVGSEFQVNTFTTSAQGYPSAAMDSAGNFVVVWKSYYGAGYPIEGQRFGADGSRRGGEFQVSTTTYPYYPAAGMDATGNFVVVWESYQYGYGSHVFGQRFSASGATVGAEFQIDAGGYQARRPVIAAAPSGNFVVVWHSYGRDGSGYGVFGRRFDVSGTPLGTEFQANTYTTSNQRFPSVAVDNNGKFVVVWHSYGQQDGNSYGVFGQRFDAAGAALGSEFQVNTYTTSSQDRPTVAMDGTGNFVVAWQSYQQDGDNYGIFGQRFGSDGSRRGAEFQINTYTTDRQTRPRVASDGSGNFVVAWQGNLQDGSGYGIFGQRFNPDGSRRGAEFQVNTHTTDSQRYPTLGMDPAGDFVVAWQSSGQDGSGYGVFGQRYQGEPAEGDGKALDYTADLKADLVWRNRSTGQVYLWTMNGATPTATSPVATVADLNWRIVGQGDLNGDGKSDLVWYNQSTGQVYVWLMNGSTPTATLPVTTVADLNWRMVATADFNGDGKADLCWHNRSTGQVYIWLMNGSTIVSSSPVATVSDLNWRIVVARDFTGDSKADLVWYNRSTGQAYLWPMNGATPTAFSPVTTVADLNWRIVASGDYNGDGRSDLVWHNRSTGAVYLWTMNGATILASTPVATVADLNWGIVAAGDFGADGKADLVWYNRTTGQVYVWQMNGATPTSTSPVATVADLNWGIVHTQ
jgi:hypothetical protein